MYEEDIDYLSETIALSIFEGKAERKEDSRGKEYFYVDLAKYPVRKLPTDKEELKEMLDELGEGIMGTFSLLDDGNRIMGGGGIYTPDRIKVKKATGESLMIYLRQSSHY